jgi:hypothetical protein
MPEKQPPDPRVAGAAELLFTLQKFKPGQELTVAWCMVKVGFDEATSKNRSKQMQVRRALKDLKEGKKENQPPSVIIATTAGSTGGIMSPLSVSSNKSTQEVDAIVEEAASTVASGGEMNQPEKPSSRSVTRSVKSLIDKSGKKITARKTSHQAQVARGNKKVENDIEKHAFKVATLTLSKERKKTDGLNSVQICTAVNETFGTTLQPKRIRNSVNAGKIGVSPVRRGPKGYIPDFDFKLFATAMETYTIIRQIGRTGCPNRQELKKTVNAVANSKEGTPTRSQDDTLINRLLNEMPVDIMTTGKANKAEERRVAWTTYSNLNTWFDSWARHLVEFETARPVTPEDVDNEGELFFFLGQKDRIINLDETNIELDGSGKNSGGRPSIQFYHRKFGKPGKGVSKAGAGVTMIGGGSAAGDPTPPHFQFKSMAKSEETKRFSDNILKDFKQTIGKFGHSERQHFDPTIGANERGGMDAVEFSKYLLGLVKTLYPDVSDLPHRRVIVKCDSGPGRENLEMLAQLRVLGVYLFPSVPNSSSVTQEMDQLYSLFKSIVRRNLEILFDARLRASKSSVGREDVGLLVFGGVWTSNDGSVEVELENAFERSFSTEKVRHAWEVVGAVPLTRACLNDSKVRHEIFIAQDGTVSSEGDPLSVLYDDLQQANNMVVTQLFELGYNKADLFAAKVVRRQEAVVAARVTEDYSQEQIEALAAAKTHGDIFLATNGTHLTKKAWFQAAVLRTVDAQVKALQDRCSNSTGTSERTEAALAILEQEKGDNEYKTPELETLLKWKLGLKSLPEDLRLKPQRLAKWKELKTTAAIIPEEFDWTPDDQAELERLQSRKIEIKDTELGRQTELTKTQFKNFFEALSPEDKNKILADLGSLIADSDEESDEA